MTDLGELSRIDAAIQQRNETEFLWAQEYCRTRIRGAFLKDIRFWMNIRRDVSRVLRELGVPEDHISAHDWSKANRQTLMDSNLCGCFCCLDVFLSSEIEEWIENETSEIEEGITDDTAFCPNCGIDSVIGSVSGYPIDRESLKKMHDYWFSPRPRFSTRHFLSL